MSEQLKTKLAEGVVKVKFTKVDGTERTMLCTTNESLVPADKLPKGIKTSPAKDTVARVFDTEIQEWRSFLYPNVISFE